MELIPVTSSTIKAIGYDAATRTLRVQFLRGKSPIWEYSPITQEAFNDFMAADSLGSHFHKHIKMNDRVTAKQVE
jgi:hypothetical protein